MSRISQKKSTQNRRLFIKNSALAFGALTTGAITNSIFSQSATGHAASLTNSSATFTNDGATQFFHACMTLPYRNYPLQRALKGIKSAGFNHVAWGTQHRDENGDNHPVMPETAAPEKAAELGRRCRDMGLEPVQMFSTIYPGQDDAVKLLTNRIKQASAAELDYVLVFGPTDGGDPEVWIQRFKQLAPIAADYNVTLAVKQHGGKTTGTGKALSTIIESLDHPNVRMSYDAGNVKWYEDVDPISDIKTCADLISAFCLKDYRNWPTKTTSGPGYGEIDHYQLFAPISFTGKKITLTYENIYPSYLGQPESAKEIDQLVRQSKLYMENVISGVQKEMQ